LIINTKSILLDGDAQLEPARSLYHCVLALSLKKPKYHLLILIYWWVRQYPVTQAAKECEVANGTAACGCVPVAKRNLQLAPDQPR
jgi:hypothetical protein